MSELAEPFGLAQPTISKHLRVLEDAGVVRSVRAGRESLFALEPKPIDDLRRRFGYFEPLFIGGRQSDARAGIMRLDHRGMREIHVNCLIVAMRSAANPLMRHRPLRHGGFAPA